ncbi:hypothetical protein TNIN_292961 [Trichonephila inaurata madagascariensis]|uniref:Uncharacterized protein n=1 Tax=Trichonephila inaurata madagascariensis TaxID=2747483 RepID=A0A8X7CIE9_9ARAC|nr:hypothetical protein TNIN_292961 [Trichonephila inaurata madagascariensis]
MCEPTPFKGARAKASVVPSYRLRGERLALEASSHLSRSCVCLWRALSRPLTLQSASSGRERDKREKKSKEDEEEKLKRGPRAGTINWLQQYAVLIDLINTAGRKLGKSLELSLSP